MAQTKAGRASTQTVQTLWEQYNETGDTRLRDRLVLTLAPMVKYIVYRKIREIPARCEVEDFISCGLEALLRSIDRYDPEKGATLEQFAWTRIHGAVLDELRRADWAPRSLRRRDREVSRAAERFVALNGRAPSRDELGAELGLTTAELDRHSSDIYRADVASLNVMVLGEGETNVERIETLASIDPRVDPEQQAALDEAKDHFRVAFRRLSPREQQVAILLYVHNLTLREIGEVLAVTESRVCQIHTQLRAKLRDLLSEDAELFSGIA